MSVFLVNQFQGDVDGNLPRVPCLDDEPCERVQKESAVVAAQQCVGKDFFILPGSPNIELLAHPAPAPFAPRVHSVEELEFLLLGREFVDVPLDELQMKFRVQFFEDAHEVRG
jgi:hypothetical protein